ncbi:MAG: carboxypeptidase regulatory-like domain-containing protein [Acidobacteria bacterium]|nr:carboxypeptidase regulatory-like domain-containing protein [Acidobacteriota bacterium]
MKAQRQILSRCLLALALAASAFPQVDTGTILGTVRDSSGGAIAGARVSLTNEGTALKQAAETRNDGSYVFTPIRIGSYSVEVEFTGFQKAHRAGVRVNIQQQTVVDFSLNPGEVTTTVEVQSSLPVLQTTNGSVGETVTSRTINNLPLSGRNYNFLARLTAGVTHPQPEGRGLNSTGWFTANGTRPAQNNFLLDGIDNNSNNVDFLSGAAYVLKPPVDAVGEFKLQTNAFSAEFGRAGGAVLNASLKSGTNELHGSLWEFLRNDMLDAADFFQNARGQKKGAYRQNQFGASAGGPIMRNRTFVFGDFEGTRIRQAVPTTASVPTALQRAGGFSDFSDLIAFQSGSRTDLDGRAFPSGTVFDPSTSRASRDGRGFVRDPFAGNLVPRSRLNANAVKLMELYPLPTGPGIFNNYNINRNFSDDTNSFDARIDHNFSERDQIFGRYSFADVTRFKPGPFDGVADGGGFNNGDETVRTQGAAVSYTHTFNPSLINEVRAGFNREHALRLQPFGNDTSNIPAKYGIQGILQAPGNGGLPGLSIGGLSAIGPADWIVSERFSNTVQLSENLTKIYQSHSFKGGWEGQLIDFPWIAPPYSRGRFNFGGTYTSIPNQADSSTGRIQFLLNPTDPRGTGGIGPNTVQASNFGGVANRKYYSGFYFQDDWKVSRRLTVNAGIRWDHFGLVGERYGAQANFIPSLTSPQYIIPGSRKDKPLLSDTFQRLLAKNGINLAYSDEFGSGLGQAQKLNFAPRFGFAYQATNKLVLRGGYGIYYGAFENRGGAPSLGYNYPFQFDFSFQPANAISPVVFPDGNISTLERGLASVPLETRFVNGQGLTLRGIEFAYKTPYTQAYNFIVQYELRPQTSLEAGYVASLGRHLETFVGSNHVMQILPPTANPQNYIAWPDFARGSSYASTSGNSHYHSMQTKFTRHLAGGLNVLATYTWAKTLTNAGDLLNGGNIGGFRAQMIPGMGIKADMALASFHVNHAFTLSGTYELPFGKGRAYLSGVNRAAEAILGGWSTNWIATRYSGQPQSIGCTLTAAAGVGCFALQTGQDKYIGKVDQFYNAAAFTNPPVATQIGQKDFAPLGGKKTQVTGPGYSKLDFSLFKSFSVTERRRLEFRAESFNLTNTPAFANPSFTNFIDTRNFGRITATRNNPNDARQIQFALKFYY